MKFGKTFIGHQIPEWSGAYMNYKGLKKQIKRISFELQQLRSQEVDSVGLLKNETIKTHLAKFFFDLDRNIENVDDFFNKQYSEYERRLKKIISIISVFSDSQNQNIEEEELDELLNVLISLRSDFRNLKWYGELNKRGFVKILKKLDKKVGTTCQSQFLNSRVYPLSFANEFDILRHLNTINKYLTEYGPCLEKLSPSSATSLKMDLKDLSIDTVLKQQSKEKQSALNALDIYVSYIENDDSEGLKRRLIKENQSFDRIPMKLLISLLNKAALKTKYKCIDLIIVAIPILGDKSDISGRNFFHHHVIALGKQYAKASELRKEMKKQHLSFQPAMTPDEIHQSRRLGSFGPDGINSNDSPNGLLYIFQKIPEHLKFGILQRDNYKRTPLHYAAQYGLREVTNIIVQCLKRWGMWLDNVSIDDISVWGDSDHLTPLHLSVLGKHPLTSEVLVNAMGENVPLACPKLLLIASRLSSPPLMKLLLSCQGINIDFQNPENNETALYIACHLNLLSSVKFLLENNASTEIGESSFGWTPLFIAASEGLEDIVKLLISYGAKIDVVDDSGWTPREHACLRGHPSLAPILTPADYDPFEEIKREKEKDKLREKENEKFKEGDVEKLRLGSESEGTISPQSSTHSIFAPGSPLPVRPSEAPGIYDLELTSTSSIDVLPDRNNSTSRAENRTTSLNDETSKVYKAFKSNLNLKERSKQSPSPVPIKSFGHMYLNPDEAIVLITLGTTDLRDTHEAIDLKRVPISKAYATELDTALSVVIRPPERLSHENHPVVLDLPLDDTHGSATDPITFKCSKQEAENMIIYFDIVPTYSFDMNRNRDAFYIDYKQHENGSEANKHQHPDKKVLGRAVALLSSAYTSVGTNYRSLNNVITVPILESDSLEVLGSVRFEYKLVNAFTHPKLTFDRTETYWKSLVSTRLIGHRGLGKNSNSRNSLQLGENTVESFIAAASLGASYVEFDVQLTKDNIPVVYHDFLVAETGLDVPMYELTAEQFLGLNQPHGLFRKSNDRGETLDDNVLLKSRNNLSRRGRAMSSVDAGILSHRSKSSENEDLEQYSDDFNPFLNHRMKLTRTWKANKFKGNSRGTSIASPFVTLEQLFKKLPKNVGFNIECKYPMLDEAQEEEMSLIFHDLNHWVDTVLKVVYENAEGRDIIFSSFHPDICILLSLKQPSIPILFLTESGTQQMADIRAASLQSAIRFARKWNLLGIVSASETIIRAPRLAAVVKASGLVCVTYGVMNNEPANANLQVKAGVDAVIVDSVLAVREGLRNRENEEQQAEDV
ncbi:Glycerophosphocholine phosphodiesterase [Komagataella phaffii CBS 7435]|uniref:Glycerophosphocholine phosphodiesterase n=1 Tax=Komagataella phaffii (strain ATCC 76273 / CBS 7435 / CECT 11047 / NRRL Y-11430 / Wegner 21-1) TaxID=981350 RepID=F2QRK0_KOMPC|nr:GQ67_01013T0 [Komagataella phaffii]AOA67096.1 GQ68_00376T0 [Komagataella phaffii GS115]CAH2447859.1 Glycerophosphocholine phosphodiesterase [Komagataella phaffii CBS 7435]CCA38028.1 Glycerophosphocholine phosphodiesterase [Komagataella phaffii CBS 7435]